jgi:hypothetical protein
VKIVNELWAAKYPKLRCKCEHRDFKFPDRVRGSVYGLRWSEHTISEQLSTSESHYAPATQNALLSKLSHEPSLGSPDRLWWYTRSVMLSHIRKELASGGNIKPGYLLVNVVVREETPWIDRNLTFGWDCLRPLARDSFWWPEHRRDWGRKGRLKWRAYELDEELLVEKVLP